ncbi:hypothetical protein WA026_019171 [Henosepilachna vigintioctopunctata]
MFELGKWLRERYNGFLSTTYKKNEIYVLSSDEDRCITSAASTLAGLFPPKDNDVWNPDLPWQPIPVHTLPSETDHFFTTWRYSLTLPTFQRHFASFDKSEIKKLCDYISAHIGRKISHFFEALLIWDILYIEEYKHLPLPEWTKEVYPEKLSKLHSEYYSLQTSTLENSKLVIGRFLHEVIKQFEFFANNSREKTEVPKMKMYSGHDINLHFILKVLEIPHSLDIPFGAFLAIELKRKSCGKLYVQLVYKGKDVEVLKIKGNSSEYDYHDFRDILSQYAVSAAEHSALISKLQSSL